MAFVVSGTWPGNIWARTGYDFGSEGMGTCLSGDCPGGLVCSGAGAAPVTLAELVLGASDGLDYYDMSLTGGFNVPVALVPAAGAYPTAACAANLTIDCPTSLAVPGGCLRACAAAADPADSLPCCTGHYVTPAKCPPLGVPFYPFFSKRAPARTKAC
jgi:hypothetical protein